ncbi:MAG: HRDC domain-containing protein, partial [Candidatus Eremiobacteraeota bacterium]|nr:HRDC domain-containing protein [Candidatus Eremiobacteraeota bacterium]
YRTDPKRLYMRISGASRMNRRELGVLCEVAVLRDEIAARRDLPLKYIMPDDVMAGIVGLRPHRVEELAQLRRLDAGARKSLGPQIVEAVMRGEALSEDQLPEKPMRALGTARETIAALMSVVVGEIAKQNELPTSLLAPRSALERVAREIPKTQEALTATLGLSRWRADLIAQPLWRLLSGSGALRIEGYGEGDPRISYE